MHPRTLLIISILYGSSTLGALVPFYRYAETSGRHFYTTNATEIDTTTVGDTGRYGFKSEGIACKVFDPAASQPSNTVPLYRYGSQKGYHFYTTNWQEIGTNVPGVSMGFWTMESIAAYVYSAHEPKTVPFYRYYQISEDEHFYTTNVCEIGTVLPGVVGKFGYRLEGIAAYVVPSGSLPPATCS